MASQKLIKVEDEVSEAGPSSTESSLLSKENIDRSSPEIWPEKFSGLSEFVNNSTSPDSAKPVYSKNFTPEDTAYLQELGSLSTAGLIAKVKELHDIAYQLQVEENKELMRGQYLNLFNRSKKSK